MSRPLRILWNREKLTMLPERALWLPEHGALLVADLHWGRAAALRSQGVPVPDGDLALSIKRLAALCEGLPVQTIWVLGDLVHARAGLTRSVRESVRDALSRLPRVHLVGGNHDQRSLDVIASLGVSCGGDEEVLGTLRLRHACDERPEAPTVCGHLHPMALLGGTRERLVLPAWVVEERRLVLPAWSERTAGVRFRVSPNRALAVLLPTGPTLLHAGGNLPEWVAH